MKNLTGRIPYDSKYYRELSLKTFFSGFEISGELLLQGRKEAKFGHFF